jgi:hypothetical protein
MTALLDKGADPNARLKKKVWYSGYSFDLSGVDEIGATAFWRAAYASDVDAMKLLVARGADPNIPSMKGAGRPRTADVERDVRDVGTTPPVPVGGPGRAAAGCGRRIGVWAKGSPPTRTASRRSGCSPRIKYLVEELHADVNAKDHEGNTALHNAAARGDVRDDSVSRVERAPTSGRQTVKARRPRTWPMAGAGASSRGPEGAPRCSRSWARRTTTSACRAERRPALCTAIRSPFSACRVENARRSAQLLSGIFLAGTYLSS